MTTDEAAPSPTNALVLPPSDDHPAPQGLPRGYGPSGRAGAAPVQRIRVAFSKGRSIRFIGHLDVVRMWERALRRCRLPLAYTLGFTPHPRLTFAAPLALGATGDRELMDVYVTETVSAAEFVAMVEPELPSGCAIVAAEALPVEGPALMAQTRWATFRVTCRAGLPPEGNTPSPDQAGGPPEQGSRWTRRNPDETVLESASAAAPRHPTAAPAGGATSSDRDASASRPARPTDTSAPQFLPPHLRRAEQPPEIPLPALNLVEQRIAALLAATHLPWFRLRDGARQPYDLRPLVHDLWMERDAAESGATPGQTESGQTVPGQIVLGMVLRADSQGSGRPDDVAAALGLCTHAVHRVWLYLVGESLP